MAGAYAVHRDLPVPLGERIGKYALLSELGRGGMGIVYRGRDTQLGRAVALKCPWPEHASVPEHRARFMREARIASRLNHSGIVPLLEVLEYRSLPWLVMPEVEGETLQRLISREGSIPLEIAIRHAVHMADALQYAHSHHVLHRDISPKNVMITTEGEALLTDFGLAHYLVPPESDSMISTMVSVRTERGAVVGTPRYMSPEQILGRDLDHRSDIFSLGTVLYEMVTGRPAFTADNPADLRDAIMYAEPPPASKSIGRRALGLDGILGRCLAKDPESRYASAGDLADDLRRFRRNLGYRRRLIADRIALGSAGVAILLLLFLVLRPKNEPWSFAGGTPLRVTNDPGWEGEPAISPDGTRIAYVGDTGGQTDLYVIDTSGGRPIRLTEDDAVEAGPCWFPDGRSLAFGASRDWSSSIWRIGQFGGSPTLVLDRARDPAVSPDDRWIAFSRPDSTGLLRIFTAPLGDPGRSRQLTHEGDGLWDHTHPSWSPDGTSLVYSVAGGIRVIPSGGGQARPVVQSSQDHLNPVWSADGSRILFASWRENTLALWQVPRGGGTPKRLTLGTGEENNPSLSRNGTVLAYSTGSWRSHLWAKRLEGGSEFPLTGLNDASMPSLASDGSSVVFVSDRWGCGLGLWRQELRDGAAVGSPQRLYDNAVGVPSHPRLSPDGRWVVFYRILEDGRSLWIVPATGGIPEQLVEGSPLAYHPSWAPDGSAVVYASEEGAISDLWVVPVRDGTVAGPPRRITHDAAMNEWPAWSPDGRWIACTIPLPSSRDIWIYPADGGGEGRQVTFGAQAWNARWCRLGNALFVSGSWGGDEQILRRVSLEDSTGVAGPPLAELGETPLSGLFDTGDQDRLLVYCRTETPRGDVWVVRK